jgi:uncharacterized protein
MSDAARRQASASEASRQSGVDVKLLELLVCPLTKGPLRWVPEQGYLVSEAAKLAYPVRDGVPVMLPSEAQALDPFEGRD